MRWKLQCPIKPYVVDAPLPLDSRSAQERAFWAAGGRAAANRCCLKNMHMCANLSMPEMRLRARFARRVPTSLVLLCFRWNASLLLAKLDQKIIQQGDRPLKKFVGRHALLVDRTHTQLIHATTSIQTTDRRPKEGGVSSTWPRPIRLLRTLLLRRQASARSCTAHLRKQRRRRRL